MDDDLKYFVNKFLCNKSERSANQLKATIDSIYTNATIQNNIPTTKFANELVKAAKSQVGVKEVGGNNKGPMIVEYQKATWLKPGAWPWCAAFVDWVVKQALNSSDVQFELGLGSAKSIENWRPKTAGAWDFENWAKTHGFKILTETEKAKAGDIVTFDFSHIGIVVEDQTDDFITTIEGNTNVKGDRDSVSGDGVWIKERNYKLIRSLLRKTV